MAFSDKLAVADGVSITLNCGLCGQVATENHSCTKRYLRNPAIVFVRCLVDPSSDDPNDLFLVKVKDCSEEYTTTRETLKRDYEEL
ncbi:MAG TPA: hypothetical protein VL866_24150 [Pyrinomonadaceae bacterium]|nr:hypothetical protein [Pyrinomonadaceae bacterium]